jgi:hypothetical protein
MSVQPKGGVELWWEDEEEVCVCVCVFVCVCVCVCVCVQCAASAHDQSAGQRNKRICRTKHMNEDANARREGGRHLAVGSGKIKVMLSRDSTQQRTHSVCLLVVLAAAPSYSPVCVRVCWTCERKGIERISAHTCSCLIGMCMCTRTRAQSAYGCQSAVFFVSAIRC